MTDKTEQNEVFEKLNVAFEQFKTANDKRIADLEENKGVAEITEQVEKANEGITEFSKRMDELEQAMKKSNRPGQSKGDEDRDEYRKEFLDQFMRKGQETVLMEKAGAIGVDADGGFAVPSTLDDMVVNLMRDDSVMRREATVIQVGNEEYSQIVNISGATTGWVGETDARSETDSPQIAKFTPSFGEVYANPAATQKALDDVFFDVESWYSQEIATAFAEAEGTSFITGDGTDKPKGIADYTTAATADSARAYGSLEHIVTTGTPGTTDEPDDFVSIIYALKAGYRNNAKWMMDSPAVAGARKLKDTTGQYLWRPGLEAGQPSTLLAYPVLEEENMPAVAANALSVAFGDFRRGYKIADVRGVRTLRDPFTNKPYVHFYTTKRVGGGVVDSQAIKFLKILA